MNSSRFETERDEAHFDFYGRNDPQDPPQKNNSSVSLLPFLPKPNTDRKLLLGMVPTTLKTHKTGLSGTDGGSP